MGSFTQLTYHVVYATKHRRPLISDAIRERLYDYIGGTVRSQKGCLIEIGGVEDHVHFLTELSPALALASVIRDIKANSSKWMNEHFEFPTTFAWQRGYGAFTVSLSQIDIVRRYIGMQEEHHKTKTFQDEYIEFLRQHGIEFRWEHLFEGEHHR